MGKKLLSQTIPALLFLLLSAVGYGQCPTSVGISSDDTDNTICKGDSIKFTANPTSDGNSLTFQWQVNGVNVNGQTAQEFSVNTLNNNDKVSVAVKSTGLTCTTTSNFITVVVNPIPTAPTISGDNSVCAGDNISLTASDLSGATYEWTGPQNFTYIGKNLIRSGASTNMAGQYTVIATVNGCTSPAGTYNVTINSIPGTPTAGNNGPVCPGETINLTAGTISGASYSWTGPEGFTSSSQNPSRTGATSAMAGTYTVTATVNGCTSAEASTEVTVKTPPAAPTAGNAGAVCVGGTIELTASTIANASYSWTGPGGWNSNVQNPTRSGATTAMGGTYSVIATVNGCPSSSATTNVTVNTIPAAPTAGNGGAVCVGGIITLTTPTVTGATYSWSGPNNFVSSSQNPSIPNTTTAMAGAYNITVTVNGCTSAAGTTNVVVNTIPTVTATTPGERCGNGSVVLGATASAGTLNWYASQTGGSILGSGTSFTTPSISSTTTYYVDATANGCTTATRTPVVATIKTIPTAPTAGSNTPVCMNGTINLTANTISNATYSWTGPDGFTSTQQNPTISNVTAAKAGTYRVTATVNGCTSLEGTTSVTVNPTLVPSVSITSTSTSICTSTQTGATPVTFTATPVHGGTNPTYQWRRNGSNISGATGATYTPPSLADGSQISVVMTSNATCAAPQSATSNVITMTGFTPPTAPVFAASSGIINLKSGICPPVSGLVYTVNSGGANVTSYDWKVPNGWTITNGANTNSITVDVTGAAASGGTFNITAASKNACGTSSQTSFSVNVNNSASVYAGLDASICKGGSIVLSGESNGYAQNYEWTATPAGGTFTDNKILNPTYTPPSTFTGTISLKFISTKEPGNVNCPVVADEMILTVNAPATAVAGTAITACSSAAINITAGSSATNNTGITWTSNGTGTIANPTSLTEATYTPGNGETGPVTLTLTAKGITPCANTVSTKTLTISQAPTAVAGTAITACSNAAINITAGSSATNNTGITWTSNGSGTINNPTSLTTATYTPGNGETGPVTLTLTATGNSPCANVVSTKTLTISQAPTAVAGSAITACSNAAINITAGSSASYNTGVTWTSNGTGTIANPTSLTQATYTPGNGETGPVTLTLTATGNTPCANAVSTKTLTISQAPTAVAGTAIIACSNAAINITAGSSATNYTTITWTSNGTGTISNPDSLTLVTYTPGADETGPVTLTLTATGNTPCANAVSTKTLTISQAATAVAGTAITACSNAAINITDGSSASNNTTITWTSNGTGTIANPTSLTTATYTPGANETGPVTLTLTASGNTPCANAVSTKTLSISQAAAAVAGTAITACSNAAINITAGSSASNYSELTWTSNGTGTISNPTSLTEATYTPGNGETGSVTLTLTATGRTPCANAVSTKILTINQEVVITTQPTASQTVCSGFPVSFTASATGTGISYQWQFNEVDIPGATSATYNISQAQLSNDGIYKVIVKGAGTCGNVNSEEAVLIVNEDINITSQPVPAEICENTNTSISVVATGTGLTYQWRKDGIPISDGGAFSGTTSQTLIFTGALASEAGNYDVVISGEGNTCSQIISNPATLKVNLDSTIILSSAAGTNDQTICINTAITPITYAIGGGGTGASITSGTLPAGVTGVYTNAGVFTISGTPTASGSFSYTITTLGECDNKELSGTINVTPANVITLSSAAATTNQELCVNTPLTNVTYTTTGATGATFDGLPNGVNGSWSNNTVTISGTPTTAGASSDYTITLTGGCSVVTATGKITVKSDNTIVLSSAANTNAQSVCVNTAITNITYTTTGATGATFSGLPAGVTGSWLNNTVTISGTPTAAGGPSTYTVTLTGGCTTVTTTGTITVVPNNTIALSSAAGTNAQSVCVISAITDITYTTTGATGATFSGLPAGVTGSWVNNIATISGTPTAASASTTYTVTLTGGCDAVTATGTITVRPNNTVTLSSAANTNAQSVCVNTPITNITYTTTGATGATFSGLPAGVTGVWANNTVTISGTPTSPTAAGGSTTYTVTLTGGCSVVTATGTINVKPSNTITLSSTAGTNAQSVCVNTALTNITYTTTGATGATFSGLPAGITGSWANNVVTISGTPTTVSGPLTYTVTLTGGCSVVTTTGTIKVDTPAIGGKLAFNGLVSSTNDGRIMTVCQGATNGYRDINLTGAVGTILAWRYSVNGAAFVTIAGETGNVLTADKIKSLNLPNTTVFRVEVGSGACTPNAFSQTAILSVIPTNIKPTPVTVSKAVICSGDVVTLSSETGYTNAIPTIDGGAFDNAGIKNNGWRFRYNGADANFETNANNTNPDFWSRATPRNFPTANVVGTSNPTTEQLWDPAVEDGNKGFAIVSGIHKATMETNIFSIGSMDQAVLTFDQAYNLTTGAKIIVEISRDGGATYEKILFSRTGNGVVENSSSGNYGNFGTGTSTTRPKNKMVIDLGDYLGQSNLRIRFSYEGKKTGDIWAVDAITVPQGPRNVTIEWNDYTNSDNPILIGRTNSVQYAPTKIGLNIFEVKTKLIFDDAGNSCGIAENEENIEVFAFDKYTTTATQVVEGCGSYRAQLGATVMGAKGGDLSAKFKTVGYNTSDGTFNTPDGYKGEWVVTPATGFTLINPDPTDSRVPKNNPDAILTANAPGDFTVTWTLVPVPVGGKSYTNSGCQPVTPSATVSFKDCVALDFDGINDYIDLGEGYTGDYSIEAWIRPFARTKDGITTDPTKGTIISTPQLEINMSDLNGLVSTNGRWYHIAVDSEGLLYVDGINSGKIIGKTGDEKRSFIGARWKAPNAENHFSGWIEEVRLWNGKISEKNIRFTMNQRLKPGENIGVVVDMAHPDAPTFGSLAGYYQLLADPARILNGGYTLDLALSVVNGKLRNMESFQDNTAPLPYTSRIDGQTWKTDDTWTHFNVWDAPNSEGINGTPITWNIVRTSHNIKSGGNPISVLGLLSESGTLDMEGQNPDGWESGASGTGSELFISHYLLLKGIVDLNGESQLVQPNLSIVADGSTGSLHRDQQGTANSFNYNYWSSPVSPGIKNAAYTVAGVLKDGTNPAALKTINFDNPYAHADAGVSNPIKISNYWISIFNGAVNQYGDWEFQYGSNGSIAVGEGYTMKGTSGNVPIAQAQNYTFVGIPNNGNVDLTIGEEMNYLIGNPYPSAIDANKFIKDNLKDVEGGKNSVNAFDGTLYFWDHFGKKDTHILADYVGGYAALNLLGGTEAITNDERVDESAGDGDKTPDRYIPVGQSFFINSSDSSYNKPISGGILKFKNSQRIFKVETKDSSIFLKPEVVVKGNKQTEKEPEKIRISYKSPTGLNRQILVGAVPSATDGFDLGYDAHIFDPNVEDMFWLQGGNWLVIQGVSDFNKERKLPLGIILKDKGEFTIKIDKLENMAEDKMVYLHDKAVDTIHDLRLSPYKASAEGGTYDDRFEVIFFKEPQKADPPIEEIPTEEVPGNPELEVTDLTIRHSHTRKEIQILNPNELPLSNLYIFDLNGNQLHNYKNLSHEKEVRLPVRNFSKGVYIIKLYTDSRVISKKIIIDN